MGVKNDTTSMLSDVQILDRLVRTDDTCIFFSPLIDPLVQIGPASLDVRLDSEIAVPKPVAASCIDLTDEVGLERSVHAYFDFHKIEATESFVLHPSQFILASTLEFVRLPGDIAARLEGRSSIGRLGIEIHSTAGFVDPGFEGSLTFELSNVGMIPVRLFPGLRIAQLCFFGITNVQAPYSKKANSKYFGMLEACVSRIYRDPEITRRHSAIASALASRKRDQVAQTWSI